MAEMIAQHDRDCPAWEEGACICSFARLGQGPFSPSPPAAPENDLRQGVTIAGHEVLDMVDARRGEEIDLHEEVRKVESALSSSYSMAWAQWRDHARAAAARLILIVDEIDRRHP